MLTLLFVVVTASGIVISCTNALIQNGGIIPRRGRAVDVAVKAAASPATRALAHFKSALAEGRFEDEGVTFSIANVDDVAISEVQGNMANYCFRIHEGVKNICFCKHAAKEGKGGEALHASFGSLDVARLAYEHDGMSAYGRYIKNVVPRVFLFDAKASYLYSEYLEGYDTMQQCLARGEVDVEVARIVGTVMGRSHARTHVHTLSQELYDSYSKRFSNRNHFDNWHSTLFAPCIAKLDSFAATADTTKRDGDGDVDHAALASFCAGGVLPAAVRNIFDLYMNKREGLVHGDLMCDNILVAPDEGDASSEQQRVKVVDFEKTGMGACCIDLGIHLCNYLFYYVPHSNPTVRRSLASAALATLEAYKSSFLLQMQMQMQTSSRGSSSSSVDTNALVAEIFNESLGFAGLMLLFLLLELPHENIVSTCGIPGIAWGDVSGRSASIRKRQLQMGALALLKFHETHDASKHTTPMRLTELFEHDNELLLHDHPSEFWF